MYVLEPQIQIRKDCLLFYHLPTTTGARNRQTSLTGKYSGKVTGAAAKRIKKAIDILLQISPTRTTYNPVTKKYFPFQINMVTLTVSSKENIDADYGYKNLMKPFLRKMRTNNNFSYVWKAELQKRGQLHYHIASNLFLSWQEIRNTWNNLQRKNRLLDDYAKKNGHFDANSTDVHSVTHVSNLGAYLAKYLSKGNDKTIKGKVWDCSTDLNRKRFAFTPTNSQELYLQEMQRNRSLKAVELEHCTIIKMKNPLQFLTANQLLNYTKWKY